jgi:predicted GH43/DUF377 family glycosyl hydrolase
VLLTVIVVFVNGWKQIGKDKFLAYYQGCDTYSGVAEINVSF